MSKELYEFSITVLGSGESVDEAFSDVLKKLSENPEEAIGSMGMNYLFRNFTIN